MKSDFKNALKQGFETLRHQMSAFADFLARLTFWRFAGLCLLLMIAAGMTQKLLFNISDRARDHETPLSKAKPAEPAEPPLPPPPQDANPEKKLEINIGEKGIVLRGDAKELERIERRIEDKIDRIEDAEDSAPRHRGVRLSEIAALLVVLMLIMRLVAKSRQKAEAATAVAEDRAERESLSRQLAEARLQAMQAQIEPHFLFNTLAAVEHLIETDPPRAAEMQRNLIGYLRSVLPNFRQPESTLGRELEISRHYLEILKMRMEQRLMVSIDVPPALLALPLPPLMLQSLVENAIRHGLEPKPDGGHLHIRAEADDKRLTVTVVDTGIGFAPGVGQHPVGGGLGLANIRERLHALFGDAGRLSIAPNLPHGTQLRLEVPLGRQKL